MKHIYVRFGMTLLAALALAAALATPAFAADLNFSHLVSGIEHRYQVRHEHIPLIGFASFCARIYTHGGVRGLRVADFEDTGTRIPTDEFDAYVHGQLGESWNVIVRSHEKAANEDTMIYARAKGDKFILLIANVEDNEISLVKLVMNANQLSKLVNDQENHPTTSD